MNINLVYKRLPFSVKAFHRGNEDGSYTVFINNRLCFAQQKEGVLHELAHIQSRDLRREETADLLEHLLHSRQTRPDVSGIEFFSQMI